MNEVVKQILMNTLAEPDKFAQPCVAHGDEKKGIQDQPPGVLRSVDPVEQGIQIAEYL